MKNMKQWKEDVLTSSERIAIPIMTHPGIELVGARVADACRSGRIHFEAIRALNEQYPAAATTVIMDLTVEAEAFGAQIVFPEDEVPSVTGRLLQSMADVEALPIPSLETGRLPEFLLANRLAAEAITDKPVLAGCIGPFSLAGRLFDMTEIMMAIYIEPETICLLLEKCTAFLMKYIQALKESGVNGVIIAEPASGLLSDADCKAYSSVYIKQLVEAVQEDTFSVILHNCGNTGHCTPAMLSTGAYGYHFGNKIEMMAALKDCPADVLVMGNLDPVSVMKQMSAAEVSQATSLLLARTAAYPNFVLSTGCDTPPHVPFENIAAFYESLRLFNKQKQR